MFFKNNIRPAFATASATGNSAQRKAKNNAFTYDAADTDDFGSFGAQAQGAAGKSGNAPKQSGFKRSSIIIAVAAIVAVILLIVVIVAVASNSSGDIKYEDNTYVAFCDADGIYRVAANGKIVGEYEYPVELRPAADHSFAYIIE